MRGVRSVDVAERRARLARRHRLVPGSRAGSVEEATAAVVGWHATTPSTVHLSAWARTEQLTVAAVDKALYADRTLVKHLAMRRTLFVFPVDLLDAVQAGVSGRVAAAEHGRLAREVERGGLHRDGEAWLRQAKAAVLEALADGRELTSTRLRAEVPLLEGSLEYGAGKKWGAHVPVGPRVLTVLAAEGLLVRATNGGAWTVSRPRWARMECWLGRPLRPPAPEQGFAEVVRRWLAGFGPGTFDDLRWWLGGTVAAARRALADVGAVEVGLDGGSGYLLPDDLEPVPPPAPWAALLPELDPATMGWTDRSWYLGPHGPWLFDRNGNGGTTAWWCGRVVGGWHQRPDGEVYVELLEDLGAAGRAALEAEAARLTRWLDGTVVTGRFPSPLTRRAATGSPAEDA